MSFDNVWKGLRFSNPFNTVTKAAAKTIYNLAMQEAIDIVKTRQIPETLSYQPLRDALAEVLEKEKVK